MPELCKDKLIENYKPLILKQAQRLARGKALPLDDLIAEGSLGLLKAADKFNPDRGASFSTYATYWIRQAMLRALDGKSRTVRLPWQSAAKLKSLDASRVKLTGQLGRAPSEKELSADSGLSTRTLRMLQCSCSSTVSLDAKSEAEDHHSLLELLAEPSKSPDQELEAKDSEEFLLRALSTLDRREAKVILLRFGRNPASCQSVGAKIGLSRESVRKIQESTLLKLRTLLLPELQGLRNEALSA